MVQPTNRVSFNAFHEWNHGCKLSCVQMTSSSVLYHVWEGRTTDEVLPFFFLLLDYKFRFQLFRAHSFLLQIGQFFV